MAQAKQLDEHRMTDTNLDDSGELDYEPSEPSANSIKEAVSDIEEEGEAGDSDYGRNGRVSTRAKLDPGHSNFKSVESFVSGSEERQESEEARSAYSGPEEGEVDDLEEGEVKGSDDDSEDDGSSRHEPAIHKGDGRRQHVLPERGDRHFDLNKQSNDESLRQQQKRVPIVAPLQFSNIDAKSKMPPNDGRSDNSSVCRFFFRGQCTWGAVCKFAHTRDQPMSPLEPVQIRRPGPTVVAMPPTTGPVPLMALKTDIPPMVESAWERGLKQARERIKKASEKKEVDPDFDRKRLTMSLVPGTEISSDDPNQMNASNYREGPRPLMELGLESDSRLNLPVHSVPITERHGTESTPDEHYSRQEHRTVSVRNQNAYVGDPYREFPPGGIPPSSVRNERQQYTRENYRPAQIPGQRISQDSVDPESVGYYHRRSTDPQQFQGDERQIGDPYSTRTGPEQQGWERRKSPGYYDRGPSFEQAEDEGNLDLESRTPDEGAFHDNDGRRFHPQQQSQRGRGDMRTQQYRPPNYHYYRTLQQQQQQSRNRNRISDQNKPAGDYGADMDKRRDKPPPTGGRNEYNYHYYKTKESQMQRQQQSGRPLPYERPSFNRGGQRSQWRDPWRRSISPGGRRRGGTGGSEHRSSRQSRRTRSRSSSNSQADIRDVEKDQRRLSISSSASSSGSSRSRSSGGSLNRKMLEEPHSGGERGKRKSSIMSSRSNSDHREYDGKLSSGHRRSPSPADRDRRGGYRNSKRIESDHGPRKIRDDRRDSEDVASRAVAKALRARSRSPIEHDTQRYGRRSNSGTSGGRSSAASGANHHKHNRIRGSPTTPPTRPLSPPPPAPFAAAAVHVVGKSETKAKSSNVPQQHSEDRKPIKLTITNKSKVRTNIYDTSPGDDDDTAPRADIREDINSPTKQVLSPTRSSASGTSETGHVSKKAKFSTDSGSGGENRSLSRREELLRQLRAVEHAIDAKRRKEKKSQS